MNDIVSGHLECTETARDRADYGWKEITEKISGGVTGGPVITSMAIYHYRTDAGNETLAFADALAKNKYITHLTMVYNWRDDPKFTARFKKYLFETTVLKSLELRPQPIISSAFTEVVSLLGKPSTRTLNNLNALCIKADFLGLGSDILASMMNVVSELTKLTSLKLNQIAPSSRRFIALPKLFKLTNLIELDLNQSCVGRNQLYELLHYVNVQTNIKILNLSFPLFILSEHIINSFDDVSGMPSNEPGNHRGPREPYGPMIEFLKIGTTRLKSLSLRLMQTEPIPVSSDLTCTKLKSICELIENNKTIKNLHLQHLFFSDAYQHTILDAVLKNSVLTKFGEFSIDVHNEFIPKLGRNTTLLELTCARGSYIPSVVEWCMQRNRNRIWKNVHPIILDAVLGMSQLYLPAYVLLEIVNWLPYVIYTKQHTKIMLILGIINSARKLKSA